jgi:hypothetical protein
VTIVLGIKVSDYNDTLIAATYVTLFSVYILIGQLPFFASRSLLSNAWLIGGSAGTIIILLILTFEWPRFWHDGDFMFSSPLLMLIFLFFLASGLLYVVGKRVGFRNVLSKSYTFLIFIPLIAIGLSSVVMSIILTNILLLALGVYTIREGAINDQLWKMNYGLAILSVLIGCRFFDTDISFVLRGLLFVAIGVGFFGMNIYMVRRRKATS